MFDVSFSELLVIAVVALIVIGPEKLPKVARTLGAISGRMQRYIAQVKEEVNRETRFESLQQLQSEIQASAYVAEQKVQRGLREVEAAVTLPSDKHADEAIDQTIAATQKKSVTRRPRARKTVISDSAQVATESESPASPLKKRAKKTT